MERRGVALLLGFPLARWRVLLGKNLGARSCGCRALLMLASRPRSSRRPLPAGGAHHRLRVVLIAAGADNYMSILFPLAVPGPGRNPYARPRAAGASGPRCSARSCGRARSLRRSRSWPGFPCCWGPVLWLVTLPLALAGGGAVYAMLRRGAARACWRREPEVLERMLGEV